MKAKKPSVLVTFDSMRYPNTGLYYFGQSLGKALVQQNKQRLQLNYYLYPNGKHLFNAEGVPKVYHKKIHKLFYLNIKGYQLVHFTDQTPRLNPRFVAAKKIITIHDINQVHEANINPAKLKQVLNKLRLRLCRCDAVVAISNFVARDVAKYFPEVKNKIQVIYNGADKLTCPEGHRPAFMPNGAFLFTIGIVSAKKNFHVLPALLANNTYQLVIAGIETAYKDEVLAQAKKYNCLDRVKIIGPISDADKAWYYQHCLAFVFPSLAEGFGLPVIEAMHFGKPVFLSTCTSLPEVGADKAYYFDSFEPQAMQQVFTQGMNHYQNTQPQAAIKQHAESFSWDNAAKQYLALYKKVLAVS